MAFRCLYEALSAMRGNKKARHRAPLPPVSSPIHPLSISLSLPAPPYPPFTRSYPLSPPRPAALLSTCPSTCVSFSRYATTKLLSFLLPFPRSPRPYLVTHKRLACNSSSVHISQRTACFCGVRVTAASRARACRAAQIHARTHECTHARLHAALHRPGTSFGRRYVAHPFVFLLVL